VRPRSIRRPPRPTDSLLPLFKGEPLLGRAVCPCRGKFRPMRSSSRRAHISRESSAKAAPASPLGTTISNTFARSNRERAETKEKIV
jgi:hypothetical protein